VIALSGVRKRYGAVAALDGVSMTVEPAEIFGLLGPNGAGKSTLVRIATTLTRADAGTCRVAGHDVTREADAVKRLIGVVFQESNLDPELTVAETLAIHGRLHRVPDRAARVARMLQQVELEAWQHRLGRELSGGVKRRLAIARALLPDPAVLFLDEPSTGLDPQIRRQLWDLIRQARRAGRTVLLTTHYIEEAAALCDRVGILRQGRLVAVDTPAALTARVGPFVVDWVGPDGRLVQHMAATREAAIERARTLEGTCTIRRTHLENVFLQLTGERIACS